MKLFTKKEFIIITSIFLTVFGITFFNMQTALRRSRDATRRADLSNIANALNKYQGDFGFIPPDTSGYIKGCRGGNFQEVIEKLKNSTKFDRELFFSGLTKCNWGKDKLTDVLDEKSVYLAFLPQDPKTDEGITYYFLSNGNRYQIYAYLEGEKEEVGYNEAIVARNLPCGNKTCNFGKSFPGTPLEKSIEEFEEEMKRKQ